LKETHDGKITSTPISSYIQLMYYTHGKPVILMP